MTKEAKDELLKGIRWDVKHPERRGGQHAGLPQLGAKLIHDELDFEVSCNYFRSQYQNREMCMTLFELFLDDIDHRR